MVVDSDTASSVGSDAIPQQHRLANTLFRYQYLDRALERPQIAGIAFSGTIGIGLFITSGQIIGFSGSLGCLLGFLIAGLIVIGVMRCLAELVSVRPVSGALMDYPKTFVDEALGFAVGVTYWLSQCLSMVVLTAAAARTAEYFKPDQGFNEQQIAGIVAGFLVITLASNICGVKTYGTIERIVKHIKFLTIVALCILMIIRVAENSTFDIGGSGVSFGFPPGFSFVRIPSIEKDSNYIEGKGIPGSTGIFLAVWTAVTVAMFACQGGDIVIVSAGEAKNPRIDLPAVTRFMYLVPIICYAVGTLLVGLNVDYTVDLLYRPWEVVEHVNTKHTNANRNAAQVSPSRSPFTIALKHSSLAPQVTTRVFDGLFVFAAYTCSNTALYAASRTLFALANFYGNNFVKKTLGRTGKGHTPYAAILFSLLFGGLAFLGVLDKSINQPILSLAAFFTSAVCCVYFSECLAFLRFMKGLKFLDKNLGTFSRDDMAYTETYGCYRAHWQPFFAYLGMVGCALVVIFSGWPSIYLLTARAGMTVDEKLKSNGYLIWDLFGAYAGPVVFLTLYLAYKLWYRTEIVSLDRARIIDLYQPQLDDVKEEERRKAGRRGLGHYLKEIWSFVK